MSQCVPARGSQGAVSDIQPADGWFIFIDCSSCCKSNMCRVHLSSDEVDEWIHEYDITVRGF